MNTKAEIAQEYIDLHNPNIAPHVEYDLESIYENIVNEVYGETRETGIGRFLEVEIGSHESSTGNPVLFTFEPTAEAE